MSDRPEGLDDLELRLGAVRFEPRASLGPEIARRARETAPRSEGSHRLRLAAMTAAAAVAAAAVVWRPGTPWTSASRVTVDRCCYDLDGGGDADDGVLIDAERDDRLHRLRLYEDRDRSGTFTPGDDIRLDRGDAPTVHGPPSPGLVTVERCCLDFDGEGPSDDGLLVIGVPPDRVVMAAIYERGTAMDGSLWHAPLR